MPSLLHGSAGAVIVVAALAAFRDQAGHRVRFRLRPGATRFRHLCS